MANESTQSLTVFRNNTVNPDKKALQPVSV